MKRNLVSIQAGQLVTDTARAVGWSCGAATGAWRAAEADNVRVMVP